MFLLDTDHIGILQRVSEPEYTNLTTRMALHEPDRFFVSVITFHEQALGWNKFLTNRRTQDEIVHGYAMFQTLLRSFASYNVLPYDEAAARIFDQIKSIRVNAMDLRIASIALSRDFTVLTRNTVDFERISNLRVEDWTV